MVFTDPEFSGDERSVGASGQTLHPSKDRSKMQTLQAAYMVCLIQNWEGTDSSKRRIRRYRFSTVVSVRRLGVEIMIRLANLPPRRLEISTSVALDIDQSLQVVANSLGTNSSLKRSSLGEYGLMLSVFACQPFFQASSLDFPPRHRLRHFQQHSAETRNH